MRGGLAGARRRRGPVLAALAAASLLAGLTTTAGAVGPSASATRWILRGDFPPVPTLVTGVACPTATLCVAVGANSAGGGLALRSVDGGVHWSVQSVPAGTGPLSSVSCPTATKCEAAVFEVRGAIAIIGSGDGGSTWQPQVVPASADASDVETLRCSSSRDCVATGVGNNGEATILSTTDGGYDWSAVSPYGGYDNVGLEGVACTAPGDCIVVGWQGGQQGSTGIAATTTDGGLTWTQLTLPNDVQAAWDVACTSASDCLVAATNQTTGEMLTTTDGGATWTEVTLPQGSTPFYLDCPTSTTCYASGYDRTPFNAYEGLLLSSTDGGATWGELSLPSSLDDVTGPSCTSATTCVAGGSTAAGVPVLLDVSGGTPQLASPLPTGVTTVGGISCGSTSFCEAVGFERLSSGGYGAILTSHTAGRAWTADRVNARASRLDAVSCVDATSCVAVGNGAFGGGTTVLATNNAGASWGVVDATNDGLYSISCTSRTACVAVGNASLYRTPSGWHLARLPKHVQGFYSVSCQDAADCVAAGQDTGGHAVLADTHDGGATWTVTVTLRQVYLDGVQCAPGGPCVVAGYDDSGEGRMFVSDDHGAHWVGGHLPSSRPFLEDAACLNAALCVAIGVAGGTLVVLQSHDDGVNWGLAPTPSGLAQLDQVTCGHSGCWAIGNDPHGGYELEALR